MSSPSFNVPKNQKLSRAEIVALIRHTLSILAQPGQTVELRIPGMQGKRTYSGYFNDFDKLAAAAADYENRAEGIYITVNPVQPALLARSSNHVKDYAKQTTSDKDVLRRRWLFIDFDPVRPAGISSSDAEHQAAIERAQTCREKMAQRGIPSLLANSGNGTHLLIPIDWPNDDASTALVKDFLTLLDAKFSDEYVKVDTGMVGASHLIKLYGTLARKGDCIPERPHRRSARAKTLDSLRCPRAARPVHPLLQPVAPAPRRGLSEPHPRRSIPILANAAKPARACRAQHLANRRRQARLPAAGQYSRVYSGRPSPVLCRPGIRRRTDFSSPGCPSSAVPYQSQWRCN